MLETSARLLRLLSLLESRRDWTGPQLAGRLGVTVRTVRNDVERLRTLGYPVEATPGVSGGYRLGVGAALPPLLLDDDEAVAVAIGLRTAASAAVTGIGDSSVRALEAIAAACRDHERLRFDYHAHDGGASMRVTEPHRLVSSGRRWYLLAWDAGRRDWRTFRVDRISLRLPAGPRFTPRDIPDDQVTDRLMTGLATATWRYRARVTVHAPAAQIAGRLPAGITVEPVDTATSVIEVGSDSPAMLALYLGLLDADFTVDESAAPELAHCLRALSARYARAAG
jgi:predicted DNA-binding transcriptional regulator YafY